MKTKLLWLFVLLSPIGLFAQNKEEPTPQTNNIILSPSQADGTTTSEDMIRSDLDVILDTQPREKYTLEDTTISLIKTLNSQPIYYLAMFDTLNKFFDISYEAYLSTLQTYAVNLKSFCGTEISTSRVMQETDDYLQKFFVIAISTLTEDIDQGTKLQELSCIFGKTTALAMFSFYKEHPKETALSIADDYKKNQKSRLPKKKYLLKKKCNSL